MKLNFKVRREKGITLIALVITIIVLLILCGVVIASLTGDNGVLSISNKAKIQNDREETMERIKIEVLASYDEDGKYNIDIAKKNIEKNLDISTIVKEDKSLIITYKNNKFKVSEDGQVYIVENREGLKVGDYVKYTYDDTSDYILKKEISGYTKDQTIKQKKNINWRILNINNDGSIELISDTTLGADVYFRAFLGYNNSVFAINDICESQYSSKNLNVKSRSINKKDIERIFNDTGIKAKNEYTGYGKIYTFNSYNNKYYPDLYKYENDSGVDSTTLKTDGIESYETYSGYQNGITYNTYGKAGSNGLTVRQSFYFFSVPQSYVKDVTLYNMIFKKDMVYWLSSRSIVAEEDENRACFMIDNIYETYINGTAIFKSDGYAEEDDYDLRPLVSLDCNIKIDTSNKNKDGKTPDTAWDIKLY